MMGVALPLTQLIELVPVSEDLSSSPEGSISPEFGFLQVPFGESSGLPAGTGGEKDGSEDSGCEKEEDFHDGDGHTLLRSEQAFGLGNSPILPGLWGDGNPARVESKKWLIYRSLKVDC
jgi:hypothetical protein